MGKDFIFQVIYFWCCHWSYQSSKCIYFVSVSTTPDPTTTSLPLKYFYSNPKLEVSNFLPKLVRYLKPTFWPHETMLDVWIVSHVWHSSTRACWHVVMLPNKFLDQSLGKCKLLMHIKYEKIIHKAFSI